MAVDVGSARRDWEDAYRLLRTTAQDPVQAEALRAQLEAVTAELRRRVGSAYTLRELGEEYRRAETWSREVVSRSTPTPGWPRTLSMVEGAAFHLYSRGAVDYEP